MRIMKKVISERQGVIEAFDCENGILHLNILTGVRTFETGELRDEEFRFPYTGDMATANKLLNEHCKGIVKIIIETEFEEE